MNSGTLTKLQQRAYNLVRHIPPGRVVTYQEIGKRLGNVKLARVVGNILNKNPFLGIVPCHRVIKSDGHVGGYKLGISRKKALLVKEGLIIKSNRIINFQKIKFKF